MKAKELGCTVTPRYLDIYWVSWQGTPRPLGFLLSYLLICPNVVNSVMLPWTLITVNRRGQVSGVPMLMEA